MNSGSYFNMLKLSAFVRHLLNKTKVFVTYFILNYFFLSFFEQKIDIESFSSDLSKISFHS